MATWRFQQPTCATTAPLQASWPAHSTHPLFAPQLPVVAGGFRSSASGLHLDTTRHVTATSCSGATGFIVAPQEAQPPSLDQRIVADARVGDDVGSTPRPSRANGAMPEGQVWKQAPRLGILARIGAQVDGFEDRLSRLVGADSASSATAAFRRTVRRGLLRSAAASNASSSVAHSISLCMCIRGVVNAESSPWSDDGGEDREGSFAPPGDAGFTEVGSHLRAFIEHRGWDACAIEQLGQSAAELERSTVSGQSGLQRFRQACLTEGALVRGWVCSHIEKWKTMRVRVVAVEVLAPDCDKLASSCKDRNELRLGRSSSSCGNANDDSDWVSAADESEGVFAALHVAHATLGLDHIHGDEAEQLLPVGTLLRARLLRGSEVDRRLLRACDASCMLSLQSCGQSVARAPRVLMRGASSADDEWPTGAVADTIAADPRFLNRHGLSMRMKKMGLRRFHTTLFADTRSVDCNAESEGVEISRVQSRKWADRRVREGVSRARAGDQKGALERYDAALELCPRHKEGLVARGAALTNVGRLKEAMRDFDAALVLDPADANALKYRDIARKRAREDGDIANVGKLTSSNSIDLDRKRRRGS